MTLQVLSELNRVLQEDVGLEVNVNKTTVLPKGVSQETVFNPTHGIINTSPTLGHLSGDFVLVSFCFDFT